MFYPERQHVAPTSRSISVSAPKTSKSRLIRAITALVGALALAVVPALVASADDAPVGSITVTVTDGMGGAPLANMHVQAVSPAVAGGLTDADGQYTLSGLADGSYSINVGDPSSVFQSASVESIEITDAAPQASTTVALTRFPTGTGSVSGRLVDKRTGAPLAGVTVTVGGSVTLFKRTTTGSDGTFEIDALATDVDYLMFETDGYVAPQLSPFPVNNDVTALGTIEAAPMTATVSGRVVDGEGNGVADMPVELNPAPGQIGIGSSYSETDSDGYYSTDHVGRPSLAAGSYIISTGLHGTMFAAQQVPVTVVDDETTTVNITLVPRQGGLIVGNVVDSNGAPISGICVFALDPTTRQPGAVSITDQSGDWAFPDITVGSYIFRMRSCESSVDYGASYLGGTTPADATVVDVHAGDDLAIGETVLLPGATISGHVDLQTPTGHASVPSDRSVIVQVWQWSGNSWVIFDADTADVQATNGDYTIAGLPAGDYKVEFYDQITGNRAYATQYWSQSDTAGSATIDGASAITLATGGTRSGIDAHLSTVRPADVPDAVATDALASGDQKTLTASDTVTPGQHLTLSLGAEHAGEWVSVWGHSTPTLLADWVEVSADGTVQVTVPTTFPTGAHRLVAQTADGTVIGWEPFTVSDSAVVTPPAGSTVSLPAKSLGVSTPRTTAPTDAASPATAAVPAPTPSATADASADASAGSSADASPGSGHKATSPVVSPASGGLPIWLLVLILGLGALIVASVIIAIARRARA